MNKLEILLFYSVVHLNYYRGYCLPIIELNSGPDVDDQTIQTEKNYYDMTSADRLSEWMSTRECLNGSVNFMRHSNVAVVKGAPNHWIQHDALQFDVECPDSSHTKYTIEFGEISGEPVVRRRFGYYKRIGRVYKDVKIEFSITELFELTTTQRNYSLNTFNSQVYARQTFLRILDQMCAKLGFYSAVDDQELYYFSDGPKVQAKNFCPNNLFPYRLDQSLFFSKYCLVFLLLITGSLILCINFYLKYKNDSNLIEESPSSSIIAQENRNGISNGHTAKNSPFRGQNERRKGTVSYNTFQIKTY